MLDRVILEGDQSHFFAFDFLQSFVTCSFPNIRSQPHVPLQLYTAVSIFVLKTSPSPRGESYSAIVERNSLPNWFSRKLISNLLPQRGQQADRHWPTSEVLTSIFGADANHLRMRSKW